MAVRSKSQVCSRSITEIARSNLAEDMDVRHLFSSVCCVSSGLRDGLITRSQKSYRGCVCVCVCVSVRDLETSTMRRPGSELNCGVTVVQ